MATRAAHDHPGNDDTHHHDPSKDPNDAHDHSHAHPDPTQLPLQRLLVVASLTLVVFLAELIGGLVSGSLALLADAGHMLTDSAGLIMAFTALLIGKRTANAQATFGYRRAEVLTALINGVSVVAIAVFIAWEAVGRFGESAEIQTTMMLVVAIVGLIANVVAMLLLAKPAEESVNIKGAYLHVLIDAASSVAVIISAILISLTGWAVLDAIVSIAIALLIVPRAWGLISDCLNILLERTPRDVDIAAIRTELESLPEVAAIHDLHVWSLSGTEALLTVHLVVGKPIWPCAESSVLDRAQELLREKFGIAHATIQLEPADHADHEFEAHT